MFAALYERAVEQSVLSSDSLTLPVALPTSTVPEPNGVPMAHYSNHFSGASTLLLFCCYWLEFFFLVYDVDALSGVPGTGNRYPTQVLVVGAGADILGTVFEKTFE
jgi:hypothetical protein